MRNLTDYRTQRARFLAAVEHKKGALHTWQHPLCGPAGEALFTDLAVIGNPHASRVMLIISGTHGVEGYYGSDNQIEWLKDLDAARLPAECAVMLIHLLNPWGAAHLRRVNEENIDLNRNFIPSSAPLPDNADYARYHAFYHGERAEADRLLAAALQRDGWPAIKRVVEAGQYQHADGLFYGGEHATWSQRTLQKIVTGHLLRAEQILSFDLHTGAGAWGHPMLLGIAQKRVPAHAWGRELYGEWLTLIDTGSGQESATGITATATGYVSQFLLDQLPHGAILPLVVECGTYAGEEMHRRVRDDHWLHLEGDVQSAAGQALKQQLVEGFWPQDRDWRELTAFRTQQIFRRGWQALLSQPAVKRHAGGL